MSVASVGAAEDTSTSLNAVAEILPVDGLTVTAENLAKFANTQKK